MRGGYDDIMASITESADYLRQLSVMLRTEMERGNAPSDSKILAPAGGHEDYPRKAVSEVRARPAASEQAHALELRMKTREMLFWGMVLKVPKPNAILCMLRALAEKPGRLMTYDELCDAVDKQQARVDEDSVTCISDLQDLVKDPRKAVREEGPITEWL